MSKADFSKYEAFYQSLAWGEAPAPDLSVYLMADDEVLIDRAKKSAREFETADQEYFLALKKVNGAWLKEVKKQWQVLEVDTNNHDFANNESDQEGLVKQVSQILVQQAV